MSTPNPQSPDSDNLSHLNFSENNNQVKSPIPQTLTLTHLEEIKPHPDPVVSDSHVGMTTVSKATSSRRGSKRKRVNRKQLVALQQKVQILSFNLKLFPFIPNRAMDFAANEKLLKHLGLWDFVHVEMDSSDLRVDLIAQLVVNYKRSARLSEVNGVRIKVSRADLGRALKLPSMKKDYSGVDLVREDDKEFVTEKSIRFIEDLMSNWMLLHDEDTWLMPDEVMQWIELIRKGCADRVEWASLMWFMVEKELSQGVKLVDCYYASHLQHLIKCQNEKLFVEKVDEDVGVREEGEGEEEEDGGDVEMVDELEEHVATAVSEDLVDGKTPFTICNEQETVGEDLVDDKMNCILGHGTVCKGYANDKVAFALNNENKAANNEHTDVKMDCGVSNEHEIVSEGNVNDKVDFALNNENEAANNDHAGFKMDCGVSNELETLSEHPADEKKTFTVDNEREVLSEDPVDDKMTLTVSSEHETLSEHPVDDKLIFSASNEHEAMIEDHNDDKINCIVSDEHKTVREDYIHGTDAFSLSNEHAAVTEDCVDDKISLTSNSEHGAEKIGINAKQVDSNEKISDELMCVENGDTNNDTQTMEFSLQFETDKVDNFQDSHNSFPEVKSEEPNIDLISGKDNIEQGGFEQQHAQSDNVMSFDYLGLGDTDNWQLDDCNAAEQPFLQPCSLRRDNDSVHVVESEEEHSIEEEEVDEEEEDEEEEVDDDDEEEEVEEMEDDDFDNDDEVGQDERINHHPTNFNSIQGMSSSHVFGVDISDDAFGSPMPHINDTHLQQFGSPATALANTLKRSANHEQNLSHRTVTDQNKRFKSDMWNHEEPSEPSSDFYQCMENIENWMGKAKMMYAAKEQECNQIGMNQQFLYGEVEQRNHMIEQQGKITNEVRLKSQMEIYKLERELMVMGGLLDTYRNALKETRREFSEYRKQHPHPEEPLYKDAGPGGLVLTIAELERQRIKQEEEDKMKRLELESTIKRFEKEWCHLFEGHLSDVQKLDEKLLLLEENVKLLNVCPRNMKTEEVPDSPAKAEEMPDSPAKADEMPDSPAKADEMPDSPAKADEMPEPPAKADEMPEPPAKAEEMSEPPAKAEEMPEPPAKAED